MEKDMKRLTFLALFCILSVLVADRDSPPAHEWLLKENVDKLIKVSPLTAVLAGRFAEFKNPGFSN